ncbi:MAG: hypothetical protein ACE5OY_02685 [Candidatus Bathyarchaeia archaeon]
MRKGVLSKKVEEAPTKKSKEVSELGAPEATKPARRKPDCYGRLYDALDDCEECPYASECRVVMRERLQTLMDSGF